MPSSETESPRPSSWTAPSIWYAAVATPQAKPGGNDGNARSLASPIVTGQGTRDGTAVPVACRPPVALLRP